jgi:hypothetical protein
MPAQASPIITRYVLVFMVANVLLSVPFMVVSHSLRAGPNSGLAIGILVLSAIFARSRFVKETGRSPIRSERLLLTVGSFLATIILSLVLPVAVAAGVAGSQGVAQLGAQLQYVVTSPDFPVLLGFVVLGLLISFLLLYLSYGPLGRLRKSQ